MKEREREKELFLGWMDTCFISYPALAQRGKLFHKADSLQTFPPRTLVSSRRNRRVAANVDKNSLMYAQLLGSAHVHVLVMCNLNFFFFNACKSCFKRQCVCGHDNGSVNEWMSFELSLRCLFFQLYSSGCWLLLLGGVRLAGVCGSNTHNV